MSFRERLHFAIRKSCWDGYGTVDKDYTKKWDDFSTSLRIASNHYLEKIPNHSVNLIVKRGLFKRPFHILALDCDSDSDLQAAMSHMENYRFSYYVIESSPGHYWVICDHITFIKEIGNMMDAIPGVDSAYINHTRGRKRVILRAFPKNCRRPVFGVHCRPHSLHQDIMHGDSEASIFICNPFRRFIRDFHSYWNSDMMDYVIEQIRRHSDNYRSSPPRYANPVAQTLFPNDQSSSLSQSISLDDMIHTSEDPPPEEEMSEECEEMEGSIHPLDQIEI